MRKCLSLIVFVGCLTLGFTSFVNADIVRTLQIGSSGIDVHDLQVLLNKDPETQIASIGAGSPGHETQSFGALTKKAVIKFQTKYASEVLYPAGLSFPTGVVGMMTRNKLSKLYSTVLPNPNGGPLPPTYLNAPHIDSVSPNIITSNQQTLTLSGSGFSPSGNTLVVVSDSDNGVGTFSSADGKTLTITFVPSIVQKIKTQLAPLKNSTNYTNILNTFVQNITGENVSVENGVTYVRAIILIRNSAGSSNTVNVKIDIKSFLQ